MTQMSWRSRLDDQPIPTSPKAPSEKALEDWIVANPSQFGTTQNMSDYGGYENEMVPFGTIIGRQVSVPSGIIDLLLISDDEQSLVAVELKKGRIDTKPFAQVLRYMHDLREIFYYHWLSRHGKSDWCEYGYDIGTILDISSGYDPEILGAIIGHNLTDDNLLIACEMANVDAYVYRQKDGGYNFYSAYDIHNGEIANRTLVSITDVIAPYKESAPDIIKQGFDHIMRRRSSIEKRNIAQREASKALSMDGDA